MEDNSKNGATQELHDTKLEVSAERGAQEGREWLLSFGENREVRWFLDARDFMATSKDAWQLRWDDLVWRNEPEVLDEFHPIIVDEELDAATFWENFAEGVFAANCEVSA